MVMKEEIKAKEGNYQNLLDEKFHCEENFKVIQCKLKEV
jgi:hypothetical protein